VVYERDICENGPLLAGLVAYRLSAGFAFHLNYSTWPVAFSVNQEPALTLLTPSHMGRQSPDGVS
jgi:hypothetical protein